MQVNTVVFDKTGTLTVGRPAVVSAMLFPEFSMEELCDMTVAAEVGHFIWSSFNSKFKACTCTTWILVLVKNVWNRSKKPNKYINIDGLGLRNAYVKRNPIVI